MLGRHAALFCYRFVLFSLFLWLFLSVAGPACAAEVVLARVRYDGGGDWYNNPSVLPNLAARIRRSTSVDIGSQEVVVWLTDAQLYLYPVLYLTGHGKLGLRDPEVAALRRYLLGGGFLYADDDYGMDYYFREALKQVFPGKELVELPFDHPIYQQPYLFPRGVPKIHEHYPGAPKGYGMFHEGRMMLYYTYNSNVSDGWANPEIHRDSAEKREEALKMGVNIVLYPLVN